MTAYFPSMHTNKLQEGDQVKIYGHCFPKGEARDREEIGWGKERGKENEKRAPCFRISLRKMFRRKQKEQDDSFICSF